MNTTRRSLDKDPVRAEIHTIVNAEEETRRDSFLMGQNSKVAVQLGFHALLMQNEFADRKKEITTMEERFKLAFTEPYIENVSTVELGVTSSPEDIQTIDGLKDHYSELLSWLTTEGYTRGEIPRDVSERLFTIRPVPEHDDRVTIVRTRQLLSGEVPVFSDSGDRIVRFGISKRMVFGMPLEMYGILANGDRRIEDQETKRRFERQIDSNHHKIDPIRTAYYLGLESSFTPKA